MRAGQTTQCLGTMVLFDLFDAVGHVFKRRGPVDRDPLTVLLEHGLGQAVGAVQGFVAEAVAVGNPTFIHVFVVQGHHTHHLVVFHLDDEIGTGRVMRADGFASAQLPGTGLVTEEFAGERTHGTDVDHVAREFGVHGVTDKGFDFRMLATVRHAQLHAASNLLAKAHTAGAMDAAAHLFHADEWPDIFVEHHAFFFVVTRGTTAVAYRQVLQLAFTTLVTDGAIQRMVDEQKFHHRLLRLDGTLGFGVHHHALRHRCGASRHGLGGFLHIHQAHAAVGRDAQLFVITKMWNEGARLLGRLNHHATRRNLYLLTVNLNFYHGVQPA